MAKPKIIGVVGPTASGKTDYAIRLAKERGGEVVSCDSMQIYRHMDIGTAKPTSEEMQGIPHHMIDIAEPEENFSVARFVKLARECIDDILERGKIPVLCGGRRAGGKGNNNLPPRQTYCCQAEQAGH